MRLVGYARVSTVGQAKDGLGLPTQERLIRSWAKEQRHRLVRIVSENGKSGTLDETQRPGLLDTLRALRSGEADGMVITSLDRLARALTVQEAVLGQVWRAGANSKRDCKMFTVEAGEVLADDPNDPMRTFVRQVMGAVSQLERGMIAKRLRNGRATKKAAGGYAAGGPPYGWRAEAGELVEVDNEQKVIARMKKMHRADETLAEIARKLNKDGVPPRRGQQWYPQTVKRVVTS